VRELLEGKKVVALGERDGVPGPAIEACIEAAGGDVVLSATECFV
jgi:betaine reductase